VKEPLRPVVASAPWNSVVIDILGPFPASAKHNKYILVCMDRFTKWPECCALRNIRAETVARAFVALVVTRHSIPLECQSDQGTQFTSSLFKEVGRILGMKDTYSAAYHPQAQGLVERFNNTLCTLLRAFVSKNQKDWCQYIDLVLFAYRTSVHNSTGFSPFELVYGRAPRLPMHSLCPPGDDRHYESVCEYVDELRTGLQMAFLQTTTANKAAAEKQKSRYDRKANSHAFSIGDSVFINRVDPSIGTTLKLEPRWMGPYLVCLVMGDELLVQPEGKRGKTIWVHKNQCKPFTKPVEQLDQDGWPEPSVHVDDAPRSDSENSDTEDSESDGDDSTGTGGPDQHQGYDLRPRPARYYGN
jgi:hypothetical protein